MNNPAVKVERYKDLPKQKVRKSYRYLLGRVIKTENPDNRTEFLRTSNVHQRAQFSSYINNIISSGFIEKEHAEYQLKAYIKEKPHLKKTLKVIEVEVYEGYDYVFNTGSYNKGNYGVFYTKVSELSKDRFKSKDQFLNDTKKRAEIDLENAKSILRNEQTYLNLINTFITDKDFNQDLETVLTEETA